MKIIKNGLIYTMAGEIIEGGDILIENGKIKDLGKSLDYPKDAELIDAGGNLLTPGFVDAHCHLGVFEELVGNTVSADDGNEMSNPLTPELRAIDGINPMDIGFKDAYMNGVTTVVSGPGSANLVGGTFTAIKTYGDRIDDMVLKEDIAMKVALGENPMDVYGKKGRAPYTRMGSAAMIRKLLVKSKNYMKAKEKAEEKGDYFPRDLELEAMLPVIKKEIPLKIHTHRADDIFTALRIAKEFDLEITLDHCTDGHLIVDHLVKENRPILVGPSFGKRGKIELANKGFKTPAILSEAGLEIAIITDAPIVPIKHLSLCAGLAYKEGLKEEEAFKAITINPAKIMKLDDRIGSIEIGKDADLVIFKGNPIKDVAFETLATFIDGELVYSKEDLDLTI